MLLIHALLLGLIEGFTEFLPISSTGHLILAKELFGLESPGRFVLEIIIQLGAILAICWLYRVKLWQSATGALTQHKDRAFIFSILIAFLPAAIIGALAHDYIKAVLFNPNVVASMLILGGFAILIIEKIKPAPQHFDASRLSWRTALAIGIFQTLAMIPGTSRSAATIMGAMLMRVERKAAAEFSFFLAIPTMFGAATYDLYKNAELLTAENSLVFVVGFSAAFVSALLIVRPALDFIGKHGFSYFAYYRILVGGLLLYVLN